jgi:thiosulfate/3-mercaptopyruvate sulfurtransferase
MSTAALPPIISAAGLQAAAGEVIVCDVRWYLDRRPGLAAYDTGHIPGAIFVDLDEHLTSLARKSAGRHPMPSAASFAASLGSLGIGANSSVVAYDDAGGMSAGRLVWMLRALGHEAALLDGGLQAWDGEFETVRSVRKSVECPIRPWPDELFADADTTASSAAGDSVVVLDARAPERFRGDAEPVDPRAGHIPGAANHPFSSNLGGDGRFLAPAELRTNLEQSGVTEDGASPIFYCGSGVSACHNLLAMEHAGLGRGRLYPGSWSQWSNNPGRPAALGDA